MTATASLELNRASRLTGFLRLMWKEYRAIRMFWISLVALTVIMQWITVVIIWHGETYTFIYNFALGAPVFFAVGCAGAAFAVEREEGTIEFLRTMPISAAQVLASKLTVAVIGTAAMFFALLPVALTIARGQLPIEPMWHGMLALWLVAAVEAIAWGILFSLLGTRPLVAVVLALVAVSTSAHLLAWTAANSFEWAAYHLATPKRGLLSIVVLGVDIYVGLRWLHPSRRQHETRESTALRAKAIEFPIAVARQRNRRATLRSLFARRDRGAMFGHLLWQHWRQAGLLMLTMAFVYAAISIMVVPIGVMAMLMGVMVFAPDQVQHRYRFFAEHNVPPRMVWLTRQLPWLALLVVATLIICVAWVFGFQSSGEPWRSIERLSDQLIIHDNYPSARSPLGLDVVLGVAAVGFAVGQFMSILIRSGITAWFFGLLLCIPLSGWVLLMYVMQVSFIWSVVPIPLVFLWASWLRAPDWITENKRWAARLRVAAAVLLPALVLLIAVPIYRVEQVPNVPPGFEPSQFEAELDANLNAGKTTAAIYRKAGELLTARPPIPHVEDSDAAYGKREMSRPPTPSDQRWIKENSAALAIVLEASRRPICIWADPRSADDWPYFDKGFYLTQLMVASARQFEGEGDLDAALDRYFATVQVLSHFSIPDRSPTFRWLFEQLTYWGAQKGQSAARILGAVKRLQAVDSSVLRLDERLSSTYMFRRRSIFDDPSKWGSVSDNVGAELVWLKLMPWEKHRAVRVLNLLTQAAMRRLQEMQMTLELDSRGDTSVRNRGLASFLPSPFSHIPDQFFKTKDQLSWGRTRPEEEEWLQTTVPNLNGMGYDGFETAHMLAQFEAERRATIVVLALQAYQLEYGELPKSLNELTPAYLSVVPLDPYSGLDFRFFPTGVPAPQGPIENHALQRSYGYVHHSPGFAIEFGVPGIWSTGSVLTAETEPQRVPDNATPSLAPESLVVVGYALRRGPDVTETLPGYTAWGFGGWFGIPEK